MEITDDMVKAKHKEFNDRVEAALKRSGGNTINKDSLLARIRGKSPSTSIGR